MHRMKKSSLCQRNSVYPADGNFRTLNFRIRISYTLRAGNFRLKKNSGPERPYYGCAKIYFYLVETRKVFRYKQPSIRKFNFNNFAKIPSNKLLKHVS